MSINLKSSQEEIRKQIEENTVVLYNLKDNNAFYAITPEEARFAIDAIKKRRENNHYCQIVPLKDQEHWKKNKDKYNGKNGITLYTQNISNLQIGMQDYYAQVSVHLRAGVAYEDSIGEIFDIAVNPRGQEKPSEVIKKGFLALLREKVLNDLETYRCMLEKLLTDNKITQEEVKTLEIKEWEVAIKLLYGSQRAGHAVNNDWFSMPKEDRDLYLERIMKENEEGYRQIEELVKEAMKTVAINKR